MKHILCFGDSNTYGYRPDGLGRYDETIRWTKKVQRALGTAEYQIIEEGLCGRTTVFQDELRIARKGVDIFPVLLETHQPLDLIIIMLGTNDCKTRYKASAGTIAKGMEQLANMALSYVAHPSNILLVSPIHLGKGVGEEGYDVEFDSASEEVSKGLSKEYKKVADKLGTSFLDAASVAKPSKTDREHLDEEGHEAFSQLILQWIKEKGKK